MKIDVVELQNPFIIVFAILARRFRFTSTFVGFFLLSLCFQTSIKAVFLYLQGPSINFRNHVPCSYDYFKYTLSF